MSYTILEFNPPKKRVTIGDRVLTIGLITLHVENLISSEYGSLKELIESYNKDRTILLDIICLLSEEHLTINDLHSLISSDKRSTVDIAGILSEVFVYVINSSMPLIKNQKRMKEIQEIQNAQNNTSGGACYVKYYDIFAKRYSYTIDQFFNLTLRQVHLLLKEIGEQSHKELEVQAALLGKKLKPQMVYEDISVEEEKQQEDQALAALKMLQERYNKGKQNG